MLDADGQRKANQQDIKGKRERSQIGRVEYAGHIEVESEEHQQKHDGDKDQHGRDFIRSFFIRPTPPAQLGSGQDLDRTLGAR